MTELELKAIVAGITTVVRAAVVAGLKDIEARLAAVEARPAIPGRDGRDGLPGVPGLPGEKGLDGRHGIDGKDGLGFGDLVVEHDGERGFTLRAMLGDQVRELGTFTISAVIHRGVYQEGTAYAKGDCVTWAGSTWIAKEATSTKPGDVVGAAHWILSVKKGRDGRDGKDFTPQPVPVLSVGKR